MSPILLKSCQKITNNKEELTIDVVNVCVVNLYPSRYQAVSSSEDKLLGVVCVR